MTSKAATISEYLEELPAHHCVALSELRPENSGGHKKRAAVVGRALRLGFAEEYVALYVCESDFVKAHLARLGKVSCGWAVIYRSLHRASRSAQLETGE